MTNIMKIIFLSIVLLVSLDARAQDINADTARANKLLRYAETLKKKSRCDSAMSLFSQAASLYKKYELWESYYDVKTDETWCLVSLGRFSDAQKQGEKHFNESEVRLITDSKTKAALSNVLGVVFFYQSKYDRALSFFRKSLFILKQQLGEKHLQVSAAYLNIANVYVSKSQYKMALEFYQKSLDIKLGILGEKHKSTADAYNNIAVAYGKLSRFDKALEFYQKSLNIKTELLGKKHLRVADTYNNIAGAYFSKAQYNKALEFYGKSLNIKQELLSEGHVNIAETYNNIGNVYQSQGQFNKAMEFCQKSLDIRLKALGEKHKSVADTYSSIARLYESFSRYEKAFTLYEKSLAIYSELLGENNINTAIIYNNIAGLLGKQLQNERALNYMQKSLNIKLSLLGEKHSAVALTYDNFGLLYRSLSQYDSAAYFHHQAVKAAAPNFKSNDLAQNPSPKLTSEKSLLMTFLRRKGEVLTILGKRQAALEAYSVASACGELAMQEATQAEDKLLVVSQAYSVNTKAALLHFRESEVKP